MGALANHFVRSKCSLKNICLTRGKLPSADTRAVIRPEFNLSLSLNSIDYSGKPMELHGKGHSQFYVSLILFRSIDRLPNYGLA